MDSVQMRVFLKHAAEMAKQGLGLLSMFGKKAGETMVEALLEGRPAGAGTVLTRTSARMPVDLWLATAPGATIDVVKLWKAIRTPIFSRRAAALLLALAVVVGRARRNQALYDRMKAIYSHFGKASCTESTEAKRGGDEDASEDKSTTDEESQTPSESSNEATAKQEWPWRVDEVGYYPNYVRFYTSPWQQALLMHTACPCV